MEKALYAPAEAHRGTQRHTEADFEHTSTQMILKPTEKGFASLIKHIPMAVGSFWVE